jgi:uncharacterized OsmC-like protein
MTQLDITSAVQAFTDDPAAARTAPAVTATLANGHARLTAGSFNWEADLPAVLGGTGHAPSPTAYLLGALAGCAVAFLNDTLAPEFDVEIDEVSATARCVSDLGGLVGIPGRRADLSDLGIDIAVDSPSDPGRVAAMQQAWLERCPVLLALRNPNDVAVTFSPLTSA